MDKANAKSEDGSGENREVARSFQQTFVRVRSHTHWNCGKGPGKYQVEVEMKRSDDCDKTAAAGLGGVPDGENAERQDAQDLGNVGEQVEFEVVEAAIAGPSGRSIMTTTKSLRDMSIVQTVDLCSRNIENKERKSPAFLLENAAAVFPDDAPPAGNISVEGHEGGNQADNPKLDDLQAAAVLDPAGVGHHGEESDDGEYLYPWLDDPTFDVNFNFLQRIPPEDRCRAIEFGLVCEPANESAYRHPKWATNWTTKEAIRTRKYVYAQMVVILTEAEADWLLEKGDRNTSMLRLIRDDMQRTEQDSNIVIEESLDFNPFYRNCYLKGTGETIYEALEYLYEVLHKDFYDELPISQWQYALPPRPPVHQHNTRPMIFMQHFNPTDGRLAINRGFCHSCFTFYHLHGGKNCRDYKEKIARKVKQQK